MVKWHMLDNVSDEIEMNAGFFLCDASVYEYSHTILKQSYERTAKRIVKATDE